jgi:glycosyltransferase involved in cell wall biosynthesis
MGFRILHSIASMNPAGGGPVEGLKQMSAVHLNEGHRVEVVSLDNPGSPWVKDGPLVCHAVGPSHSSYGYTPRLVPWLRSHLAEYDVVVVNGLWQYSSFGVWQAARRGRIPYLVFTHGMLDPWFKRTYPVKHLKKWLYWPWAEYRVLRDASAVLFTCEEERRLARGSFPLYRCKERVVGYGTKGPTGEAAVQKERFLDRFPQLSSGRCLLFLGRVHVKKGTDLLLRAFAATLARKPKAQTRELHLVMAGPHEHEYGIAMRKLADSLGLGQRVTWTGLLMDDFKWGAFHAAQAFVLPSHQENFGVAVVEALACGVPVLLSNQVNIWPEIEQAGAGFVENDDLAGTERLIERWLSADASSWARMRDAARTCFAEHFHVERTAKAFIRALEQTAGTPGEVSEAGCPCT